MLPYFRFCDIHFRRFFIYFVICPYIFLYDPRALTESDSLAMINTTTTTTTTDMIKCDEELDADLEILYASQMNVDNVDATDDQQDTSNVVPKGVDKPIHCVGRMLSLRQTPRQILQPYLLKLHTEGFNYTVVYMGGKHRAQFDPTAAFCKENVSVDEAEALVPGLSIPGQQMSSEDWSRNVVARLSPWIDPDSPDPTIAQVSCKALRYEMEYAIYLRITTILVPLLRGNNNKNLIQIVKEFLIDGKLNIWMMVPLTPNLDLFTEMPSQQRKTAMDDIDKSPPDTWEWWYSVRSQLPGSIRLGVCLVLSQDISQYLQDHPYGIRRWAGEFVKLLWFQSKFFNFGPSGAGLTPDLRKATQLLFANCSSASALDGEFSGEGELLASQYVRHLWNTRFNNYDDRLLGECMDTTPDFVDIIQIPLQPLADNLDMDTYQVFEVDPVKYPQYEEGIYRTLLHIIKQTQPEQLTLAVLGAGRGPLVLRSFNAIQRLYDDIVIGVKPGIRVFVVEKNPMACIGLRYDLEHEWPKKYRNLFNPTDDSPPVTAEIVSRDMRNWSVPGSEDGSADVVVSELLGSFGDNELSPECLDGCPKVLGPKTRSIPCSYSSFIGPLHAPRLFHLIKSDTSTKLVAKEDDGENPSHPMDVPYVVLASCCYPIDEPRRLFTFDHPNTENKPLQRESSITFRAPDNCELMGFVGYFEATLYKDSSMEVMISIKPKTFSRGMFSWFPIVFPLRQPIPLKAAQIIRLDFKRKCDESQVWYEWRTENTPWQNQGAKTYAMKL